MKRMTFGRVAYVTGVNNDMLELIQHRMNCEAVGNKLCYVDWCEIISYSEYEPDPDIAEQEEFELQKYIRNIEQKITGEITGVCFIKE